MPHKEDKSVKLVVISPENDVPLESETVSALIQAGLERYHLRKPTWTRANFERWFNEWPYGRRDCFVLHAQHDLVGTLKLGGRHWRDDGNAPLTPRRGDGLTSRSCHDLESLESA